jgi:hypothetical protein
MSETKLKGQERKKPMKIGKASSRNAKVEFGSCALVAVSLCAVCVVAVPVTSFAGIKYWDNPDYMAFDVDDYVSGAILNYDGIRNQGGTDSDHDSSATTWKNLGGSGADYDLAFKSGETTTGEWANDGYIFHGGPRFWTGHFTLYSLPFILRVNGNVI